MKFAWRWMVLGGLICVYIGWETSPGYGLVSAMLMTAAVLATLAASSDGYLAQRRRIVELEAELLELEQEAIMKDRRNDALARRIAELHRELGIEPPETKGDLTS
jgi:hypothetical protein